ncbi:hypothetical protein [Deinococcus rubellus]|uniref:Uncharacterized protein n=1 Tax=Deinococcus rubellus TaxID=1889240 RepID=A0ABY5YHX5_9DEIO|nr:hypothetical protein [Deinococcus rubellus]UWX64291.1 hypothetical protein N0D28_01040 [Deinococcus rubellus]
MTEVQVVEIRAKYAQGGSSYASLAAEYGTSKHNVAMIVKRRIWAHV